MNFKDEEERAKWIIGRAKYFTTVRFKDRKYERQEHETLELARAEGRRIVSEDKSKPVMIYAVAANDSSAWVENIYG